MNNLRIDTKYIKCSDKNDGIILGYLNYLNSINIPPGVTAYDFITTFDIQNNVYILLLDTDDKKLTVYSKNMLLFNPTGLNIIYSKNSGYSLLLNSYDILPHLGNIKYNEQFNFVEYDLIE